MKAIVYDRYGPPEVLRLAEAARPAIAARDVLVKVHATTVTTADWRLRAAAFPGVMQVPGRLMFGLLRPKNRVLGGEFAGEVAAVGAEVTRFAPGDRVFGFSGQGAHAEYLAVAETSAIAAMPEGLGAEAAAALPFGTLCALVFLRDYARLAAGQRVLVVGASGGVGCYAVQIAMALGAEVTGVCSAAHLDLVRRLGAAHVIDYRAEDFTQRGEQYDVILDTVGATSFARCMGALTAQGRFVPLNFGVTEMAQALATKITGGKRVVIGVNADTAEDLAVVKELVEAGQVRPVIDRSFPLERIADAYRLVETRHRKGSVVVTLD